MGTTQCVRATTHPRLRSPTAELKGLDGAMWISKKQKGGFRWVRME